MKRPGIYSTTVITRSPGDQVNPLFTAVQGGNRWPESQSSRRYELSGDYLVAGKNIEL